MLNPVATFTLISLSLAALPALLFALIGWRKPYRARTPIILLSVLLLIGLPFSLYLWQGSPSHLLKNLTSAQIVTEDLVNRLAKRLQRQPEDPARWLLLGRSYLALQQPKKALQAFENSLKYAPNDELATLLWAETALKLNLHPEKAANRLRQLPQSSQRQWLLGMAYMKQGADRQAIATWERLLNTLSPDTPEYQSLKTLLESIRRRAGAQNS